jgi:uncharacterized membrane protein YciS (DUF1049 family)
MFQQTYVLAVVAWTLPYTILRYKIIGGLLLVVMSAWIARWSWYTVTGFLICEFSVFYRQALPQDQAFYPKLMRNKAFRLPYISIPITLISLGTLLKYLWIAILPDKYDNEYVFHADINTAKLLRNINPSTQAYPRYDDWLIATGLFILLELSPRARKFFSYKPLVFTGRLSFSIVLISGTVMMSLGSLIYQYLVEQANITSISTLIGIMFIIMIPISLISSFIWWITVDEASIWISHLFYKFLTTS